MIWIVLGVLVALAAAWLAIDWLMARRLKRRLQSGGRLQGPADAGTDRQGSYDRIDTSANEHLNGNFDIG